MKHMVRISFNGRKISGGPQQVLLPAGLGPDVTTIEDIPVLKQTVVYVTLERDDPRLGVLLRSLEEHACSWLEFHTDKFSDEEIAAARLFVMLSSGECEIDGGAEWGTTFDLTAACPACGTGARQTSALFVDGRKIPMLEGQRAATTYLWHYLVDEGLAADLERVSPRGLSFRSVYAVMEDGRQVKLRWKQLLADRTLPPMSPKRSGFLRDGECNVCDRNGYGLAFDEAPWRFTYREADLRDLDDIHTTWENAGFARLTANPRESLLSRPFVLVSPKLRRVFLEAGVTTFTWTPILVDAAD